MKTLRLPLLLFLVTTAVRAQGAAPAPPSPAPADPTTTTTISVQRTPQELDQLLAPIALYPDALIALILPASTVPTDIVLAARHLRENPGDRSQIEHRAWDESVKSLTNYPDVVKWMDENLHWTQQVGEAFSVQPAEVMQAVQRLRTKARAAGTLVDTPQQQVITDQQAIRIVPAQPNTIYVPQYDPEVVFVDSPVYPAYPSYPYNPYYYSSPFLTFGVGVPVGSWLAYDCDWHHHSIWMGNRHRHWKGHDWHRPLVPFAHHKHPATRIALTSEARQWRPPPVSRITVNASNRFRSEVVRPAPLGFARSSQNNFRDSNSPRSHTSHDSALQTFRGSSSVSRSRGIDSGSTNRTRSVESASSARSRSVDSLPVVPSMPRDFSPGFRSDNVGPHAAAPVVATPAPVVPSLPTARANSANLARSGVPAVQSPSQARRSGGDGGSDVNRDFGNRSRSFRSSQPVVSAPLPAVPALPMATPPRSAQPAGPSMNRSFSRRESSVSAPAVVPALPMQNRTSAPAAVGPVAPQVVAPAAAPATTPQAAPAQQRGNGEGRGNGSGESRGNRFGGGRRSS